MSTEHTVSLLTIANVALRRRAINCWGARVARRMRVAIRRM